MHEVAKIVNLIGSTSGYTAKLALLKDHAQMPGLKDILRFIYDPYCKTGISTAKLSKVGNIRSTDSITWQDAINYFRKHQTGSSTDICFARDFIEGTRDKYGDAAADLAEALVTQDLKIGITATSLNKVYGANFIPKTGCMLGTLFGDVAPHNVHWPCIVTEKLDGIRRILVKENGVCRFYSRSGHEDTGLLEITAEAAHLPDNFVYDGELLAKGTFKDCIAQRQATNSIANSKGVKTGLTFNIFDMVPVKDFYAGICTIPALERKIRLAATLMDESLQYLDKDWTRRIAAFGIYAELQSIKHVPILGVVHSIDEATPVAEAIWRRGGEGIMLNTASGKYEIKRSKQLLKVKHTEEHVLTVVDAIEGSGKYEDALGALIVNYKGSYVGVGSGFTDEQRSKIWNNLAKYIGKQIEVETFGESINQQGYVSLNCPIFKRFVGEAE